MIKSIFFFSLIQQTRNEGWLKYDMGTTKRFFSFSPTYTATQPFGTSTRL
ncbi:hypothetical protein Fmac_000070 [Flemingia macrophylla]|uniref:Uncharacterized protein n=1 Tax=Flemingia macrophylla TaxID=520843 RepID=A0ABD1NG17_9FABA